MRMRCECRLPSGVILSIKTVDIVEAAESGDFEFVLAALEREESPDSTDKNGMTPLMLMIPSSPICL